MCAHSSGQMYKSFMAHIYLSCVVQGEMAAEITLLQAQLGALEATHLQSGSSLQAAMLEVCVCLCSSASFCCAVVTHVCVCLCLCMCVCAPVQASAVQL
jgi:hypothetical protein